MFFNLGVAAIAFAAVTMVIAYLAEDYLVGLRVREQLKSTNNVAVSMAPYLSSANSYKMYELAEQSSKKYGGRFLVLNKSGIVLVDSFSTLNGQKLDHKEISDVLLGPEDASYGFHEINTEGGKPFYAVYYTAAVVYNSETIGAVLFSAEIQDVVDITRDFIRILVMVSIAACVVFAAVSIWLSGYITRPINDLKAVALSISRGNLHQRIHVSGKNEMAALAHTFNTMSEKLENMDKKRSEFVSNASHELKTPLSSIKILIESLLYQDGVDERIYKEFLGDINKEIDRLSEVIGGLLTLARTDSETQALNIDKILLSELVFKSVTSLKPIANEKGVALSFTVNNDLEVECDALKVMQAVMNLVENAIKYTDAGGSVQVVLTKSGANAAIAIRDNGSGIPEKDIPYLFDRFYRVDKARARGTGGSGLGLHIAQKIALLHGGSIDVQSEEGKGSEFTLYLPIKSLEVKGVMLKKLAAVVLAVVLLAMAGCVDSGMRSGSANLPDINPNAGAANKTTARVALYFSYNREELLAAETATVNVPVSEPLEAAVVRALITGPSVNRTELYRLFWDGVELVGVDSNADILFVTLSEEFVSTAPEKVALEEGTVADQKRLAICSIVNTIVEMGTYSRVQIYIDRQDAGAAQRITRQEAGWEDNSDDRLDPLGRMGELILTPQNTLIEALGSFEKKNWARLYNFIAYTNPDGSLKPDNETFSEALDKGNVLESFSVTDFSVSSDGQEATVMLNYSIKTREGETLSRPNIPVKMVREEDIWKLSYTSLVKVLVNAS